MKIVQINSVCGVGSTGRICAGIAEVARSNGHECIIAYGRSNAPEKYKDISYRIESNFGVKVHALKSRLFGKTGTYSKRATKRFLKWLDEYKPDILHLHNLHGYYINVPMLFDYIKKRNIHTIWTLHDCWTFTGHCACFDLVNCDKWKAHCTNCVYKTKYPKSLVDDSKKMFDFKRNSFMRVEDLTIVTPSQWLDSMVKQSFLRNYGVCVIYNGIDLDLFKPVESNFREQYGLQSKKIVLGVAFQWGKEKGLDVFVDISRRLSNNYQIVLVGINNKIKKELPENIISISRTNSQTELAQIYSAADVFVNPTRQEVLGMVNIEALACGTPVVTFNTGGSPETIDVSCGIVVPKNDIQVLIEAICRVCEENTFSSLACVKRAQQFNFRKKFEEYIDLYTEKE